MKTLLDSNPQITQISSHLIDILLDLKLWTMLEWLKKYERFHPILASHSLLRITCSPSAILRAIHQRDIGKLQFIKNNFQTARCYQGHLIVAAKIGYLAGVQWLYRDFFDHILFPSDNEERKYAIDYAVYHNREDVVEWITKNCVGNHRTGHYARVWASDKHRHLVKYFIPDIEKRTTLLGPQ